MSAVRRRLDRELVRRGLAPSREAAAEAVAAGRVLVGGAVAGKPAALVAAGDAVVVTGPPRPYASRGGEKLAPALEAFGVVVAHRRCLDAGASTGGFTDVLLQRGAAEVHAVDVGYGQLDGRLQTHPRVRVHDRTNVRGLTLAQLGGPVAVVVADLSFISLVTVLPVLAGVATPEADLVVLVKPQFEVGRSQVGRRGVVRDPALWASAIRRVAGAGAELGLGVAGLVASTKPGPAGNIEFLAHLRRGAPWLAEEVLAGAITQGEALSAGGSTAPTTHGGAR